MRKEKYLEKIGKCLNFYAKQSDHTHFFFNIPMILLV
jgi:hypothetical protein